MQCDNEKHNGKNWTQCKKKAQVKCDSKLVRNLRMNYCDGCAKTKDVADYCENFNRIDKNENQS